MAIDSTVIGRKGRTWPQEVASFVINELPRDIDFGKLDVQALSALLSLRFFGKLNGRDFRDLAAVFYAEAR